MLQHLHIRNLIIVETLSLELSAGMTALTGETGAGKSILIDALDLVLGKKADRRVIRAGAERAEIHAVFDISQQTTILSWLRQHDLDSEDECVLQRSLVRSGRSRAFVNGRPVALTLLQELGNQLVDIHGQNEHQSLLQARAQRALLDAYAGHSKLLQKVENCFQTMKTALQQLEDLHLRAQERTQRLDYLQFQIDELQQLNLTTDELETLETEQKLLAHSEQMAVQIQALQHLLEADDGVAERLAKGLNLLENLPFRPALLDETHNMLDSARIQVEESLMAIRDFTLGLEQNPQRLADIDQRLEQIHDLARKHRVEPSQLPQLLDRLQIEYDELLQVETRFDQLQEHIEKLEQNYRQAAASLSASRAEAARRLASTVTEHMQHLAMQGGRFDIQISPLQSSTAQGLDKVAFLVAANPGQNPAALAQVASGGELSRISLAIQVATANCGQVPTLIFDEVDSGIGGAVAETVGQLLRKLGKQRQILCITHLPQVAARAHNQLRVEKYNDGQQVRSQIQALDHAGRVEEIARMLGGSRISDSTRQQATEMLAST